MIVRTDNQAGKTTPFCSKDFFSFLTDVSKYSLIAHENQRCKDIFGISQARVSGPDDTSNGKF